MASYIRPTIRNKTYTPPVFVTFNRGNTVCSEWVHTGVRNIVSTGTPGRVGEICTRMDRGDYSIKTTSKWTPPHDYVFYARRMIPDNEREAYIKKCKDWFAEHPPKEMPKTNSPMVYNYEMVSSFWFKKTALPPLADRVKIMKESGMPENRIEKHIQWDKATDENSEKRQDAIDAIFGKYATSKTTTKVKVKAKVLKPVKKKIT